MDSDDSGFRFEQLEQLLLGEAPKPPEGGTDIGNTCISPAILTLEFALRYDALFISYLRNRGSYPRTALDEELPPDALMRDLKVAVNGCLVIEDVAARIQKHMEQMEAGNEH